MEVAMKNDLTKMRLKLDGPRHAANRRRIDQTVDPTRLCPHRTLQTTQTAKLSILDIFAGERVK